jgi:peptidoglycan/LPS O-acetylase OafA/YrhL
VQKWLGLADVWGLFWTLPFELMIYAGCSLLFGFGLLNRVGGKTCIAIVAAHAVWGLVMPTYIGKPAMPFDSMRGNVLFSFLFGLTAYRYCAGQLSRRMLYSFVGVLAMSSALVWARNHALYPSRVTLLDGLNFGRIWLVGVAAFLFLTEVRRRRMPRVACWLGRRSYPIYLLHPLVISLSLPIVQQWTFVPCVIFGTLLLAALVHRWVESPGIAWGKRIEKRFYPAKRPMPVPLRRAA